MSVDRDFALSEVPEVVLRRLFMELETHLMAGEPLSHFRWDKVLQAEVDDLFGDVDRWLRDWAMDEIIAEDVAVFDRESLFEAVARLAEPRAVGRNRWKVHWLVETVAECPSCGAQLAVHRDGESFACPTCRALVAPESNEAGVLLRFAGTPEYR